MRDPAEAVYPATDEAAESTDAEPWLAADTALTDYGTLSGSGALQ